MVGKERFLETADDVEADEDEIKEATPAMAEDRSLSRAVSITLIVGFNQFASFCCSEQLSIVFVRRAHKIRPPLEPRI